ncbi:MAG: hypothetical protein FD147_2230 [Chloroflexi bacterium]|nr:MAG: hypothetical protein FD147_2230 [Chloroflexota bacterium]
MFKNQMIKKKLQILVRVLFSAGIVFGLFLQNPSNVFAAPSLTITPLTWNVIGLDSNNVNVGPNTFPVGARV